MSEESTELICAWYSVETKPTGEIDSPTHHLGEIKPLSSSSGDDPPRPDLKELPSHLKYVFLGENQSKPVIISSKFQKEEDDQLVKLLKENFAAIGWGIGDIKGISATYCTHRISLEDDAKPVSNPSAGLLQ